MKRVLVLATAAAVVLGAAAAPALSLKPYRPQPVEFSMAGSATLGHPGRGDGVISEPFEAPKRFNLVGLTWRAGQAAPGDPGIAIRTRSADGEWTAWEPVSAHAEDGPDPGTDEARTAGMANPVWAGEADWVQYRATERLPGAQLHFVNTAGTATPADRIRTALRGAASTAVGSVASVLRTGLAGAQEPQPEIVSRDDWGADGCKPRTAPSYGQVKAVYVHHTVNINDYTRAEARQIVLGICRYHRNTNGWNDIGYNFLVDRFGTIYEGRAGGAGSAVIGAQSEGFNSQTSGVANIGTYSDVGQSQPALEAMARLIRWKLPLHGYPTSGTAVLQSAGGATSRYPSGAKVRVKRVLGHRDTNATECPGGALYAQLGELRELVGGIAPLGTATTLDAELRPRRGIGYGQSAALTGRLVDRAGTPIVGQPVNVQARVAGRWRPSSTPLTAPDGSFAATLKPRLTRLVRVRFAGAGDLRSSVTPALTLAVRPILSLRRPPRRGVAGTAVRVRGRVTPRKRLVHQVLAIERGGRFRRVGVKALRTTRGGAFDGSFVPAGAGIYRYYFVARADALRARGSSDKIEIDVRARRAASVGGGRIRLR